MSIEIPDWVVSKVLDELFPGNSGYVIPNYRGPMKAALRAALEGWLEPAPALHISERCAACGDVLHASVSATSHYLLRKDKTP